jgi:ribose transport system permease protein
MELTRFHRLLRNDWLGAAGGVALVAVLLSFLSPYFLTSDNLLTILVQTAVVAILAGGQTFVILIGQIDLATAAVTALAGAVVGALMAHSGLNPYLGIGAAIAVGGAVGLVNGVLVAFLKLPSFIVTLAGLSLWRGLGLQLTGGFDSSPMPDLIGALGRGEIGPIPAPIVIMLGFYHVDGVPPAAHQARPLHVCDRQQRGRSSSHRHPGAAVQGCGLSH